jgi:hypothetical protein
VVVQTEIEDASIEIEVEAQPREIAARGEEVAGHQIADGEIEPTQATPISARA